MILGVGISCKACEVFVFALTEMQGVIWPEGQSVACEDSKKNLKIANIATVLGEAALYGRFNIQATVRHVSDIDSHEHEGNMMAVRTAVVHCKTGFAKMTVFSQLTKEIADGKSYKFTNVNVGRHKKEHILKIHKKVQVYLCKNTVMENNKI